MSEEKEKRRGRLPRFVIRERTLGWSIATLALCIILYLMLGGLVRWEDKKLIWNLVEPTKNLLVVVTSILGTTLITGFLIEKRSRNEIFTDTLLDELSLSLDEHNKNRKKLLETLEQNYYFSGNKKKREIYGSIIRQRDTALQHTYATRNYHRVVCTIYPDRIEKEIVREIWIRSYDPSYEVKNFVLAGQAVKVVDGISRLEMQEVTIDNEAKTLNVDYELVQNPNPVGSLEKKNDYSNHRIYRCKSPLLLSSEKDTKIVVKYKTSVPPNDFTYCIRMRRPCKDYSLEFRVSDSAGRKCCLNAHAFGFCEDAINTLNDSDPHSVSIHFDDWIFYNDGVCISFYPQSEAGLPNSSN